MIDSEKHSTLGLFTLMFSTIFLLNLIYTMLRSVRNTLAIADVGGSAGSIPYLELFGVLPAACLMTWLLSFFLRQFSTKNVFFITLFGFITFFVVFSSIYYPSFRACQNDLLMESPLHDVSPMGLKVGSMIFYVVSELWKPVIVQILFWGLVNLNVTLKMASKIYPLLMLGSCCGSVLAGPITVGCTSKKLWRILPLSANHWCHSFILMMFVVFVIGIAAGFLYHLICRYFEKSVNYESFSGDDVVAFDKSIKRCFHSKTLRLFCWVVIADYIAYSLGEVIFLEVLKHKFPNPVDYCRYHGYLAFWSSGLTLVSALTITPFCLSKFRWIVSAMTLPVALLLIEGAFFIFLRAENLSLSLFGWSHGEWVGVVVAIGSLQYCVCRAIKYTFFDCSKELAFAALPKTEQVSGKLIVDGICARLGRGGGSALSLSFIAHSGGILASSFITGVTAIGIVMSWVFATQELGKVVDKGSKEIVNV